MTSRWSSDFLDGNKGGEVREIWHSPVDSVDLLDNVSMHKTVLRKEMRDGLALCSPSAPNWGGSILTTANRIF